MEKGGLLPRQTFPSAPIRSTTRPCSIATWRLCTEGPTLKGAESEDCDYTGHKMLPQPSKCSQSGKEAGRVCLAERNDNTGSCWLLAKWVQWIIRRLRIQRKGRLLKSGYAVWAGPEGGERLWAEPRDSEVISIQET